MQDIEKTCESSTEQVARTEWVRPEVRRIDAASAEGAAGAGVDNVVFS
ncbi:hypothetical protein [Allosphingosinicella sp.]|jgi:hypothetical protein